MDIEIDGRTSQTTLPHHRPAVDRFAIVDGARTITHDALHARANQVARMLQARNLGAESRIGVLMDRSIEFVIAVLGITKAGAAYLPLNPTYPASRLAFVIDDAKADLILHADALPSGLERTDRFLSIS